MRVPFSNLDAFLLHIETPTNLMVVTGLLFLDGPVDIGGLRKVIEERLLRFERFQQRIIDTGLLIKTPKWEFEKRFKIEDHVHKVSLAPPGDEQALKDMVNALMAVPMDMAKSPWHMYLVEDYQGGSVIVGCFHHTLADGLSLVNVINSLGDEAASSEAGPPVNRRSKRAPLVGRLVAPPLKLTSKALGATQWVLRQGLGMVENPDYIKDSLQDASENAQMLGKYVLGSADPKTSLRGKCGVDKNCAWSEPIPLEQVKSIGRKLGGTVNDVILTAVTGGLRRYLEANGEAIDFMDLRAVVPVNLRSNGDYSQMGNQVGMVLMPLPVGEQDPLERFRAVKSRMDELKRSGEPDLIYSMLNLPVVKAKLLATAAGGVMKAKASLLVTNVPGPQEQISFGGKKIVRAVFWVPQPAGWGLGISILSYAGEITLGAAADAGLIPEPGRILEGMREELEGMALER